MIYIQLYGLTGKGVAPFPAPRCGTIYQPLRSGRI